MQNDYGAIDAPAATAPKRIGRKTVVALVATLGLAAGVAALSLTPSKKTADVASLYDPTEPHPKYCPWEPNHIVCSIGCGILCRNNRPTDCTRVKCCSKETCRNPPPLPPPTPPVPTNPEDYDCAAGGCDQSNIVTTGSVSCSGGDCIQTGITADGSISCGGGGCAQAASSLTFYRDWRVGYAGPQTGSTAKGGITCPDDPCAKCGEGGMTGRPRAFYSPPGQPPIPVPAARCAKPLNGLTDCTDLCRKFPNAGHTTACCKCYPAC